MEETNTQNQEKDEPITAAQLRKLNLEIESLRTKNRWERIAIFIPLITILVTVSGFCFTVVQYFNAQAKDREFKEQEQ